MLDPTRPWSRADRWAAAVLATALLGGLPFLVHPWYEPRPDASTYILTSQAILQGDGYRYLGQPFRLRPPGMSLLIAPVLAVWGVGLLGLGIGLASHLRTLSLFLIPAVARARLLRALRPGGAGARSAARGEPSPR